MIEVELKYRLTQTLEELTPQLEKLNFHKEGLHHQVDSVFIEQKHASFESFQHDDPVARVRLQDEKVLLTVKRQRGDNSSIEHEVECSDFSTTYSLLETLGYRLIVTVDKVRQEFSNSQGMIVTVDEVKHLGRFLEIEFLIEDGGNSEKATKNIKELAAQLGLGSEEIVLKKYDTMMRESGF